MSLLNSFFYSLKEARFNPVTIIHSSVYAATVTYLKALKFLVRVFNSNIFRTHISETYHAKVLRLSDAEKIITINRDIELRRLDQLLPYRHARDLILINPQNIVVYECPCRAQKTNPCRPTEVCLVIGDPFADLLRLFQPFRSRRITTEEALRILKEEDDRGHLHSAWFKQTMLDRFYAICNCCSCCCLGMKFMTEYKMKMLLPSGYRAVIDENCLGCGTCVPYCQFGALEMIPQQNIGVTGRRCRVVSERCFGCGVCEGKCSAGAIILLADPEKGSPLDIEVLATAQESQINLRIK